LLDIFTIKSELGKIGNPDNVDEPMVVTLLGDLKHGLVFIRYYISSKLRLIRACSSLFYRRTVHSLVKLLGHFKGVKLQYVSPEILSMPEKVMDEVKFLGIQQEVVKSVVLFSSVQFSLV
jgi:aspartate carbamoyltransferase catalytic subunit